MRRQHTKICVRSPTEKETGGDKFDSVVANSQTDVKSSFSRREVVSGPIVLVHGMPSVTRRTTT